jgi:hypothetical protein
MANRICRCQECSPADGIKAAISLAGLRRVVPDRCRIPPGNDRTHRFDPADALEGVGLPLKARSAAMGYFLSLVNTNRTIGGRAPGPAPLELPSVAPIAVT